jgi:hypothetical protein
MSVAKVNHNVFKPFSATSVAKGSTDSTTCEWLDINGWTDKKVSLLTADNSASIDVDVNMLVSPKGYYELNNETTVDANDYESIELLAAHTTADTLTTIDAQDIDELQRPMRSCKFTIDNDDASTDVAVTLWIEGWS